MATKIEPIAIRNFLNGVINDGVISDLMMPDGAVREAINFHFDKQGDATLRQGLARLGDQASSGNTILGMHYFRDAGSGTNDQIIAAFASVWFYLSGSTWTSIRSGLASNKARFITFLDSTYGANGSDATVSWNGDPGGGFGATNTASMPAGNILESFKNRLFTNVTASPQRLSFSSIASSTSTISWTSGNGSIDFYSDGGDITGLKTSQKVLLVFKPDFIYRLQSTNQTEPDPVLHPGTFSHDSIVEGDDGQIYYHAGAEGIYSYGGVMPSLISKPIKDFTDAVPSTFFENVGGWRDTDHIYHALGDLTIGGVDFPNIVVRRTISSKVWTIYSYGEELRMGTTYDNGTNIVTVVGDTDGNVHTLNSGTTDNGTEIAYSLVTRNYDFNIRSAKKLISKIGALSDNGIGMLIQWKADSAGPNEWNNLGTMTKKVKQIFNKRVDGFKIQFRIAGASDTGPFEFQGFEILQGLIEEANE